MTFEHLIREARRRADVSQAELARRAGVPQSTVGRTETGARVPSVALVERLIRAAGFEVRAGLGEPDPELDSLIESRLQRSVRERLADATRAARFVLRGREALRRARHGKR